MLFRQFTDYETFTYTYLIADLQTREAVFVDSSLNYLERYLKVLRELSLKLTVALETHIHADHITAAAALREKTQCRILVPQNAEASNADGFIKDNEQLCLNSITIKALATPGHTDAHMAYLINNDRVLTGDALFIRGCGRTDFQSGNPNILYDSIHSKLFSLPDETLVFPGHDYNGCTVSTIGEEKRFNPRLAGKSKEQFIEIMQNLNLSKPKFMDEAVPANLKCGKLIENPDF